MLHLHNTLSGKKEPFEALDSSHVRMYVCGPTVYAPPHMGNARPFVVFDVLYRLLSHQYPKVTYVRNITDIDDKIIARSTDGNYKELTKRMTDQFHEDMAYLHVLSPTHEPRATDFIPTMINMIETLIHKGHAYISEGHVLFSVDSYSHYGHLCTPTERHHGARVSIAAYKKNPADFILWKPAKQDEPYWDSPFGKGRPGWHLECSAMGRSLLGEVFDIHGGGLDLIFPHHENEIAQSACAHNTGPHARYWVHNGYLMAGRDKMSKSLGNLFTVADKKDLWAGEVLRHHILKTHYRQPLHWDDETSSKDYLNKLYRALPENGAPSHVDERLLDALNDDINTPKALSVLSSLIHEVNTKSGTDKRAHQSVLLASAQLLGFAQTSPSTWFKGTDTTTWIESAIKEREKARAAKDFTKADTIRQNLASHGILLEDTAEGTLWKRK